MIPVQILHGITGAICFDWLRLYTHDKHEQEKLISKLAEKYDMSAYEIRQAIEEIE